jgi:serine/threonine-protein kinase RsbW
MEDVFFGQRELLIDSKLDRVEAVLKWFDSCWTDCCPIVNCDDPLLKAQAQTAVVELFTNSVRHSHSDLDPAPQIRLSWGADSQFFRLSISDHGRPFAPEEMFDCLRLVVLQGGARPDQRDQHWGLFMLLRLCDDYGWFITSQRSATGVNTVLLEHAWLLVPDHTEKLWVPSTTWMKPAPACP